MPITAGNHTAPRIAIVGDRQPSFVAQDEIESALAHSGAQLDTDLDVRWVGTEDLADGDAAPLADAHGIWCAPGSPYRSFDGALAGIRFAREHQVPFLGTCAGFQHGVIEFARNVLGMTGASSSEYGPVEAADQLFIDELLCSVVGQRMTVAITDPTVKEIYGTDQAEEQYYCRFGLLEEHTARLAAAGLHVLGVDLADGGTRILRLADHPSYVLTLFVPQCASTPERPHPLVTAYLLAAMARAGATAR